MLIKNGILHDGLGNVSRQDILIQGGVIKQIGNDLEDDEILDAKGRNIFPGFIDPFTVWGINGSTTEVKNSSEDNEELTGPLLPELEIIYAVNGRALSVQQLPAYGITACGVVPTAANIFGGQMSVFYTYGMNALKQCISRNTAMVASVSGAVKAAYGQKGTFPMTKMGIFQLFKDALRNAVSYGNQGNGAAQDEKLEALSLYLKEKKPFFVYCDDARDRKFVYEILKPYDVPIVFLSADNLREGEIYLTDSKVSVINGYDGINMYPTRKKNCPDMIKNMVCNGVNFVASGTGSKSYGRENYMWSAIQLISAVRDREKVLGMMTIEPARLLGIEHITGSIEEGKNADLTVWSENPLECFQAKVDMTMICGEIVYQEGDERRCYY